MIQEQKQERYRGVLCEFCRQPIPLPSIVARAEVVLGDIPEKTFSRDLARAFHIRCRACDKEASYHTSEIIEIEGAPRLRSFRARTTPGIARAGSELTKAANG